LPPRGCRVVLALRKTMMHAGNANPVGTQTLRGVMPRVGLAEGGYLVTISTRLMKTVATLPVFDGVMPWLGYADRVFINVRFATQILTLNRARPTQICQADTAAIHLRGKNRSDSGISTQDHQSALRRIHLSGRSTRRASYLQRHGSLKRHGRERQTRPRFAQVRLSFVGKRGAGFVYGSSWHRTGYEHVCDYANPGRRAELGDLRASLKNMENGRTEGIEPPASQL